MLIKMNCTNLNLFNYIIDSTTWPQHGNTYHYETVVCNHFGPMSYCKLTLNLILNWVEKTRDILATLMRKHQTKNQKSKYRIRTNFYPLFLVVQQFTNQIEPDDANSSDRIEQKWSPFRPVNGIFSEWLSSPNIMVSISLLTKVDDTWMERRHNFFIHPNLPTYIETKMSWMFNCYSMCYRVWILNRKFL